MNLSCVFPHLYASIMFNNYYLFNCFVLVSLAFHNLQWTQNRAQFESESRTMNKTDIICRTVKKSNKKKIARIVTIGLSYM